MLQFMGSQRVEHNSMTEQQVRKCYSLVAIMPFTRYIQGTVESSVSILAKSNAELKKIGQKFPLEKIKLLFFKAIRPRRQ